MFFGGGAPKSDRKLKLSDFGEIWYPGVFEGADFKNRTHYTNERSELSVLQCGPAGFFFNASIRPSVCPVSHVDEHGDSAIPLEVIIRPL